MDSFYDISAKEMDYCQENYSSFEYREIIPEYDESENFVIEEPGFINDKDINSEIIRNEKCMIPEIFLLNQNYSNSSKKEIKLEIKDELILKTENSKTTQNTKKKPNSPKINKNLEKEIDKTKKGSKHNLIRKSKKVIIDTALIFINKIIFLVYNGNIGYGIFKKELKKIDPNESQNTKVIDNINLLNKTLKDIFSTKINGKYTGFSPDINKKIIEELLNEKDESRKKIFTDLFSKTFLDFNLMLKEPKDELNKIYENILLKYSKKGNEALNGIKEIINNYEKVFLEMKPKKNN